MSPRLCASTTARPTSVTCSGTPTAKATKVKHRTLGNLSHLPERLIDIIRRSLQGESFVTPAEAFRTVATKPHGHVEAVLTTFRKLDLEDLIASKPSRKRSLILALIAQRLLLPCSKLATTRRWHT